MRKRTQARELALQLMYQLDLRGDEILDEVMEALAPGAGDPEIDRQIEEVAKNWQLKRMAAIDRNILRLATYELLFREDIPPLVTINEAIDIAKKFSTKNSGPFVNGILDNIRLRAAPPGKQRK
jgi:transcription termination factor NusB